MIRKVSFLSLVVLLCVASDCNPEPTPSAVLPENLVTIAEVDGSTVNITATADNANFYSFTFYDGDDSTYQEASDGMASYTYTSAGTYQILTRAHSSYYDFIEYSETVEITEEGFTGGIPTTGYETPLSYPGMTLVWQDEFEGNSLSSDWVHEIGNDPGGLPGWGNNELQYYKSENTTVSDGLLKITAKQEFASGFNYTSSRIKTQGIQSFKYGRVDIRASLPYGQGMWPALWMLGDNITSASWPGCGEIDIMELIGGDGYNDRTIYGTLHWLDNGSHANYGGNSSLPSGELYAEEFHVFSIIWDESSIRFLRDDVQYHIMDITGPELTEFHQNFFFIFNIAVGGNWPGSPDSNTQFPQTMAVDYVRIFQ
ncbi:MAG: glycoside hydrolase family 16 protein [Crocinitomicaceae bacterium]